MKGKKKHVDFIGARRMSDMLKTLKTRDLKGHGKYLVDPLVIHEEDTTVDDVGSNKKSKSWEDICKGLTQ